ncbi:MAG: hypothetical protein AAB421_03220 [Patescibacteria group bacterium]
MKKQVPRFILKYAHSVAKSFSPYAQLLARAKIKVPRAPSQAWFESLPVTSKESYIKPLSLKKIVAFSNPEVVYASSGSSGSSTFWFRDEKTVQDGADLHRFLFEQVFGIKRGEPTLVIVTFGMGLWIAGSFTADVCRALRRVGFVVSVATPGIEEKDIRSVLRTLGPAYRHIVIAGYPPFLLDIVRRFTMDTDDVITHPSLFILTAGDKHSEEWRAEMQTLIGRPGADNRVINLYGSAEAGPMAFETPKTISLRRKALRDASVREQIFAGQGGLGGLFNYLPKQVYFECAGEELLITKVMPVPLVRYNTHDRGVLHVGEDFKRKKGRFSWEQLPLVAVSGRTDVALTLYALNMYPEHLAITLPEHFTGSYLAFTRTEPGPVSERLVFAVELKQGATPSTYDTEGIREAVVARLLLHNSEYRKLHGDLGTISEPAIELFPYGELPQKGKDRALLCIHGKKPRIVFA